MAWQDKARMVRKSLRLLWVRKTWEWPTEWPVGLTESWIPELDSSSAWSTWFGSTAIEWLWLASGLCTYKIHGDRIIIYWKCYRELVLLQMTLGQGWGYLEQQFFAVKKNYLRRMPFKVIMTGRRRRFIGKGAVVTSEARCRSRKSTGPLDCDRTWWTLI